MLCDRARIFRFFLLNMSKKCIIFPLNGHALPYFNLSRKITENNTDICCIGTKFESIQACLIHFTTHCMSLCCRDTNQPSDNQEWIY